MHDDYPNGILICICHLYHTNLNHAAASDFERMRRRAKAFLDKAREAGEPDEEEQREFAEVWPCPCLHAFTFLSATGYPRRIGRHAIHGRGQC